MVSRRASFLRLPVRIRVKPSRLARSRVAESTTILRASHRGHIGEIIEIGWGPWRELYEKSDRRGAGRLPRRAAQRMPRRRAAATAAVRELTSNLAKMLL